MPHTRRSAGFIAGLTLFASLATSAAAAVTWLSPNEVTAAPPGTCFEGDRVDPTCQAATDVASDWEHADGAQTAAILAAHPEYASNANCLGSPYLASTVVSRLSAADLIAAFNLPSGTVTPSGSVTVPSGFFALDLAAGIDAYDFVSRLYADDSGQAEGKVAPLYGLTLSGPIIRFGPGESPLPTTETPWTPPVTVTQVQRVVVFDTANSASKADLAPADGWLDPTAGHGTFITSLVRSAFPNAGKAVSLVDVTDSDGLLSEATIAGVIGSYGFKAGDVANLSAGTYGCYTGSVFIPPLLLSNLVHQLNAKGVHLVAAAGNNAVDRPFYPAAWGQLPVPTLVAGRCGGTRDAATGFCLIDRSSTVTSVGSVESAGTLGGGMVTYTTPRSGERSDFSNFGDWVEAWADGSDVVGTYLAGPYRYCEPIADTACDAGNGLTLLPEQAPTAHLASTVVWSGTSFAAPQVAIWIAAGNPAP